MDNPNHEEWLAAFDDPKRRNEAARVIFSRYYSQLLSMLQSQLPDRFLPRFDSEDVLQSAFFSFYKKADHIADAESLFPYLKSICTNKLKHRMRFHEQEKRDVNRHHSGDPDTSQDRGMYARSGRVPPADTSSESGSISSPTISNLDFGSDEMRQVLLRMAAGFSAEDFAQLLEFVESLPEETGRIFCHKLTGMTEQEIARTLNRSRRTVTRKMQVVRAHLDQPDD